MDETATLITELLGIIPKAIDPKGKKKLRRTKTRLAAALKVSFFYLLCIDYMPWY